MFAAGESGPKRAFLRLNHIDSRTPSQIPLQMIREYLQLTEGRHPGALKAHRLRPWCDLVLSWCLHAAPADADDSQRLCRCPDAFFNRYRSQS
jgi:hypothetical protein